MRILYDYQTFTQQRYGGISRYFCELAQRMPDCTLSLKYSINDNLLQSPKLSSHIDTGYNNGLNAQINRFKNILMKFRNFPGAYGLHQYINQRESIKALQKGAFEIFHPTYYNPYFLKYLNGKPFVLTVHDMIHEIFPYYFGDNDCTSIYKKKLVESASAIIAVSQNTKMDILKFYDILPEKIFVIYHGNSFDIHGSEKSRAQTILPYTNTKFILYIGNRMGYKNFDFLIRALASSNILEEEVIMVCCGGGTFSTSEIQRLQNLHILDKCFYVPGNDKNLEYLYRHASVFVFPSLYEGFGMPILEAFSCGCPVLLSNTSSLPEVGGDAALYFNPTNEQSFVNLVDDILSNNERRKELIRKGYLQLKKFSWDKTAEQTKFVYKKVIGEK